MIRVICKICYCIIHIFRHGLNICHGIFRLLCQYPDFLCNNCKSLSGLASTCCLNGCIQCKQISLSGNRKDRISKHADLFHNLCLFKCLLQPSPDFSEHRLNFLSILHRCFLRLCCPLMNFFCFRSPILCTYRNLFRCTINLLSHTVDLFCRCGSFFSTCSKLLCCRRHILNFPIQI